MAAATASANEHLVHQSLSRDRDARPGDQWVRRDETHDALWLGGGRR
jgi:hypothetical protein